MLLKPEPLTEALQGLTASLPGTADIVHLSPGGVPLTQQIVRDLSRLSNLILICGHYEGIDQRFIDRYVQREISLGDYILSGGETAAMVVVDAVCRLLPGVLGSTESALRESFEDSLLEYPQYTRPAVYRGDAVPEVLLEGNHGAIARWRRTQAIRRTMQRRPDLLLKADLSGTDQEILRNILREIPYIGSEGS